MEKKTVAVRCEQCADNLNKNTPAPSVYVIRTNISLHGKYIFRTAATNYKFRNSNNKAKPKITISKINFLLTGGRTNTCPRLCRV